MFKEYSDIFRKVIELADAYYKAECPKETIEETMDDLDDFEISNEKRALIEYLSNLDYEVIKVLQIIMYIGRDNIIEDNLSPQQKYLRERNYFDSQGWQEDKMIEIHQMTDKFPLVNYLNIGFKLLEINI